MNFSKIIATEKRAIKCSDEEVKRGNSCYFGNPLSANGICCPGACLKKLAKQASSLQNYNLHIFEREGYYGVTSADRSEKYLN